MLVVPKAHPVELPRICNDSLPPDSELTCRLLEGHVGDHQDIIEDYRFSHGKGAVVEHMVIVKWEWKEIGE